jgi:hypothetical protein
MIVECLHYAASFPATPKGFRTHLAEAVGLWARGRRQARAWAPHTGRTASLIERTIDAIANRRTVVVLGSGPLFDVPLEALAAGFDTVILVDRAHLAAARRRARPYGNVRLLWRDLAAAGGSGPLAFLNGIEGLDWVISVNLVSQLAYGAPEGLERGTIDAHLDALARLPCPVTLVTDTSYEVIDAAGRIIEDFDLLYGRPLPESADQWHWEVSPLGEESRSTRRVHKVAFYADWRLV